MDHSRSFLNGLVNYPDFMCLLLWRHPPPYP